MKFEIAYEDPETRELITETKEFFPSKNPDISAQMWAEDYAYGRADKGFYAIKEDIK